MPHQPFQKKISGTRAELRQQLELEIAAMEKLANQATRGNAGRFLTREAGLKRMLQKLSTKEI